MQAFKKMSLAALAIGAVGCGGGPGSQALGEMEPAALTTSAEVGGFANGSAVRLYGLVAALELQSQDPQNGNCPVVTVDGNTTTYEGGCSDAGGNRYVGRFTDRRDAAGSSSGTLSFDGFGTEETEECANGTTYTARQTLDGTLTRGGSAAKGTFDIDMLMTGTGVTDTCQTSTQRIAIDYTGEVDGGFPRTEQDFLRVTTWNGKGRIGLDGLGKAEVETVDEKLDANTCQTEAVSGSTTITSGENKAVITYDGAAQCTLDSSATWTLNGTAQGSLSGVGCSAVGTGAVSAWGLVALGGLLLRRRRQQ